MSKISKRYKKVSDGLTPESNFTLSEAVKLLKEKATVKFDETVDIAMNLGVDPKHSDQNVRGVVSMPKGTGKTARVAVFAKDKKAEEAKAAGADLVGADDLAEKVEKGEINFDRIIATPDMMAVVGKLGKVLGPRGLMPNPKLGSVTMDIEAAVKTIKSGQVEFKVEKAGIIHAGIGKASFKAEDLIENLSAFINSVNKAKPSGSKGQFIKKVSISSSMGPAIKIDLNSLEV
tara:strand:- start:215 stop:910 length:696 start_codon:yes stop_codon:yes gene_type:complete